MLKNILQCLLLPALLGLAACTTRNSGNVVYSPENSDNIVDETPEQTTPGSDPFIRQRILADMLYEARMAYEDNRLMSPAGNNAYDKLREVLSFDPENAIALQGVRDIVQRYVELADAAIQVGQYDNADSFLNRADQVGVNRDMIGDARQRLAQAREIRMDVYALDGEALNKRNLEIMVELGEIGQKIRDHDATFLINARTDEEGRWIYKTMREAVGGYRLRGNIALDAMPSIQVTLPNS